MKNTLPMTLLAQMDDIAVFQTAAFVTTEDLGGDKGEEKNSHFYQQSYQKLQASYGELNLGLHVNDDANTVLNNRMRVLAAINKRLVAQHKLPIHSVAVKALHWVNQVHGKQIHDIDETVLNMKPMAADAMVSKQDSLGLAIMTADCVPIVLYQPTTGQIAAIHAGWQGLACGVIRATIERFKNAGAIKAWMGVCISQNNYEVGTQVRDKLLVGCIENQTLSAQHLERFEERYVLALEAGKVKLNLPQLAADQLRAAEVVLDNQSSIACSYAEGRYYSYRRQTHLQQPATGRMALIITRSAPVLS